MGRTIILSAVCAAALTVGACVQTRAQANPHAQTQTPSQLPPQSRLTIEDCQRLARAAYPLARQSGLVERAAEYSLANAARGWLPQVSVSAQASYQSDVTRIPFDFAQLGIEGVSIPTLGRDQYGARVEVQQTVWDGGAIDARREGVRAAAAAEIASVEANLYTLHQRVNGLYFGILLAEGRLEQIAIAEDNLATNYRRVEACVRGGVAMQADLDALGIERLKVAQQRAALAATDRAYRDMLSRLIGVEIGADTELIKPSVASPRSPAMRSAAGNRPEMAMYDAQIGSIAARERALNAAVTPRLGVFATGGYGKPGLNMLADKFKAYYVVGARLSWNIGALYTRKNDLRQIGADVRGVELRRDAFLLNTDIDAALQNSDIDRLTEQLGYDDEIIALRGSVRRSSESKMERGTLSGSDLARDINAESAARQDRVLHEMELLMAVYNLKFITND